MSQFARSTDFEIKLSGSVVEDETIAAWVVEQDVNQPDMCVLTLHDPDHAHASRIELGAALEVAVHDPNDELIEIFDGEVVGLEPTFRAGGESLCVVRAFNRLHRLLRGRHSRTYVEQTDSQIAQRIASENDLASDCDSTPTQYEHVYQHNQSDYDFLRARAARIGFEVMVVKRELLFRKPRRDVDSGLELVLAEPGVDMPMMSFTPRMSSSGLVDKVEVRGWDPVKKEEVVATYEGQRSPLGKTPGYQKAKKAFGARVTYQVDMPVSDVAEAEALAEARFHELAMDYITGEAYCIGHPKLKAGLVVKLVPNPDNASDRFNGKYRIAGTTHRYGHGGATGVGGGYTTTLRVRRDAEEGA